MSRTNAYDPAHVVDVINRNLPVDTRYDKSSHYRVVEYEDGHTARIRVSDHVGFFATYINNNQHHIDLSTNIAVVFLNDSDYPGLIHTTIHQSDFRRARWNNAFSDPSNPALIVECYIYPDELDDNDISKIQNSLNLFIRNGYCYIDPITDDSKRAFHYRMKINETPELMDESLKSTIISGILDFVRDFILQMLKVPYSDYEMYFIES